MKYMSVWFYLKNKFEIINKEHQYLNKMKYFIFRLVKVCTKTIIHIFPFVNLQLFLLEFEFNNLQQNNLINKSFTTRSNVQIKSIHSNKKIAQ